MSATAFIIIAIFTLSGALAAACLRKLIHAALCLVLAFVGLAAFYFFLGAEFVGLVQVFVYVGAVAVLIVFTILLTRREDEESSGFNWGGVVVALAVFAGLVWTILKTSSVSVVAPAIEALELLHPDYRHDSGPVGGRGLRHGSNHRGPCGWRRSHRQLHLRG